MLESCEFTVSVSEEDVMAFAKLSGDWNPLHVNAEYAATTEYGGPIVHGALVMAFASRVLGMYIPGTECVILSIKARFPHAVRYPAEIVVGGFLQHLNSTGSLGRVLVTAKLCNTEELVLDASVDFMLHVAEQPEPGVSTAVMVPTHGGAATGARRLLVTGGTGGLGSGVIEILREEYALTCLTRRNPAADIANSSAQYVQVDLDDQNELDVFLRDTDPSEFYGIVHMSSPTASKAFASDDAPGAELQLRHAVVVPLALTKWARRPGSQVRRLVLVGSQFGNRLPQAKLGTYTIAKGAMETMASVLVADLAGQHATVNVIALGPTSVGMNDDVSARTLASLATTSGTGRICTASDLANLIVYLLSEAGEQVNGCVIPVDGGVMR